MLIKCQRQQRISGLYVVVIMSTNILMLRVTFTELSMDLWLKEEILLMEMEQEEFLFMGLNSLMRIS